VAVVEALDPAIFKLARAVVEEGLSVRALALVDPGLAEHFRRVAGARDPWRVAGHAKALL
jgi:hypothetical protein